jgi:hypothetical protein
MTAWTGDELNRIGTAEELQIASRRGDGTLRQSTIIWVVRVGDDLYVRAVKGRTGKWFQWTQEQHEGRIQAGGLERDVTFEEVASDAQLNDLIDAAYRAKYRRYATSIINSVVSPAARAATLRLVPHSTGG